MRAKKLLARHSFFPIILSSMALRGYALVLVLIVVSGGLCAAREDTMTTMVYTCVHMHTHKYVGAVYVDIKRWAHILPAPTDPRPHLTQQVNRHGVSALLERFVMWLRANGAQFEKVHL